MNVPKPSSSRLSIPLAGNDQSPLVQMAYDFSNLRRPCSKEISKFRDIFYVLVLRTRFAERKRIAENLAPSYYTPRPIAIYLAMEEIQISAPVLLFSPVLTSIDLNQIISKNAGKRAAVIARRNDLDITTVAQLLNVDDEKETLRSLMLKNSSLLARSDVLELLEEPSKAQNFDDVSAQSLAKPTASELPWLKTQNIKDKNHDLLEVARVGKPKKIAPVPDAISAPRTTLPSQSRIPTKNFSRKVENEPKQTAKAEGDIQLTIRLLDLARVHDLERMAEILAENLSITEKQAFTVLSGDNAGMQASAFCALGFTRVAASKILLLINNTIGRNAEIFKTVMLKYGNLDQQTCLKFFHEIETSSNSSLKHLGSFSAAIAERRRNFGGEALTRPLYTRPSFGKLNRVS